MIIGGGVIGLTIARALARRGVSDTTVIDKSDFGREASWAAGGILAPQVEADCADDFFTLACASRDLYPHFARELEAESGVEVAFDATGALYVAFGEAEEAALRRRADWQQNQGLRVEWLTGDEARQLEPSLSANVRCALRFPDDYQVDNRKLVEALRIANQRLGVRLIEHCEANSLKLANDRVVGVETSHGFISSPTIIVAAGAWSSTITSDESMPGIEIEPVRGQMLCFPAPEFARHVIFSSRGYLIPRRDGRLLAGSTTEHVGFDKTVTDSGVNAIKSMAFEIAPVLRDLPLIDSWAGFRPRAKDGLPIIGRAPGIEGLVYATGHYRNGILLAPITGELISRMVVDRATPEMLSAFSPKRFLLSPAAFV